RQLMLGFDVDAKLASRMIAEWSKGSEMAGCRDELSRLEDDILNIFVDICSLFHQQPGLEDSAGGEAPSAEAYLFSYLRILDTGGEGLPLAFVDALRRALAHYGVQTLERSRRLEESLLWIYKSHQRMEQQLA